MTHLLNSLSVNRCSDIMPTNPRTWLPYDQWARQVSLVSTGKSGPCHAYIDKSKADQLLSEIKGLKESGHIVGVSRDLRISHSRKVHSLGAVVQVDPPENNPLESRVLKPKDLTPTSLQMLAAGGKGRQEIMDMYGFTNLNYFREKVKALGCRDLFKWGCVPPKERQYDN